MGKKKKKRYDFPHCAICGKVLHGIPRLDKIRKYSKSQRRVNRKYGGYLCSECAREVIKDEARKLWIKEGLDVSALELKKI